MIIVVEVCVAADEPGTPQEVREFSKVIGAFTKKDDAISFIKIHGETDVYYDFYRFTYIKFNISIAVIENYNSSGERV